MVGAGQRSIKERKFKEIFRNSWRIIERTDKFSYFQKYYHLTHLSTHEPKLKTNEIPNCRKSCLNYYLKWECCKFRL